jgi:hypothetical protein
MRQRPFIHLLLNRWVLVLLVNLCLAPAWAQSDPPGRVARLDYIEGAVTFSPVGDNEWIDAQVNRPLVHGDRLWTDKGSRAEIQAGSSAVRMSGQTQLEVLALDDQSTQLSVTQGTVYVRVRTLPEGENFEIDTPNLAFRAAYPGDYRVDVDATGGTTRVTIHSGTGAVYGEAGQSLPLGGGQQITFRARSLAQVDRQESPPQDNFDRWAAERNRHEDQSVSARFVPREVVGYQELDAHGQWVQDATYGAVWFPQGTPANWAPFRDGHWEWIAPWGWTWIDDAPWGFAPSHYGRWAMINSRWAWVPGRLGLRPIYAPALVAFIGGGSTSAWSIPIAAGRPGVAWFPLAPGEPWQPGFKASAAYVSNVNRNMAPVAGTGYVHQGRPDALTAISSDDFQRGHPVRGSWLRVAANALTKAQIVPPPPMPERRMLASRERPTVARAAPPSPADVRPVAGSSAPPPQAKIDQAKLAEQAKRDEQAKAAEQAKAVAEAKAAEQARAVAQAKAIEQAKVAQQIRIEQMKAEQAKAEQAKAEQSKLAQQARAAERAKAAEQAKAAQPTIAAQPTKLAQQQQGKAAAAEQAKLAQQSKFERAAAQRSQLVEQKRLAQQAKAAERARRVEQAKAEEASNRERLAKRAAPSRRETVAHRSEPSGTKRAAAGPREEQARRSTPTRRAVYARHDEKLRQDTHAQQVEQARRAADREAETLRLQREQARRNGQEYEQNQREMWDRYQQTVSEQWRRDQQSAQQRDKARQRPNLRNDAPAQPPEVWQRGIPILNPGPTS